MEIRSTKAAILVESRKPLIVDEIELPSELRPGQILVRVHFSSICGAQINEIDAVKGPDKFLPHLLGHEASATVVELGPGVTQVKEGDTVVLHWRPSLGFQGPTPSYKWGQRVVNAGWVTTFNEYAVVSENRMTVIPANYDRRTAPLLGCAVTTAAGVVSNDASVKVGDSVVIFGIGGVGLNLVQFARLAGAYPIVAIDRVPRKLEMATSLGATHTLLGDGPEKLASEIKEIVGTNGADRVIETTGARAVIEMAYDVTSGSGTCVLVGVPNEKVAISTLPLHFDKTLTGSHGGNSRPHIDIPRIIRLEMAGRISFEGIITNEYPLDAINDALELVRSGTAGRVLLRMGD
jgi:S-(hydroxymethyl)glutathione dehydrogenase/alcohol dehydrogenase